MEREPQSFETNNRPRRSSYRAWKAKGRNSKWHFEDAAVKDTPWWLCQVTGNQFFHEDGTFRLSLWLQETKLTVRWLRLSTRYTIQKAIRQMWARSTLLITLWNLFKVDKAKIHLQKYVGRKSWLIRKAIVAFASEARCRWTVQVCSV